MKKKIAIKIYMQVVVGFFFSLLIILYFSFRLLFPLLLQIFNLEVAAYIIFFLSFGMCSLMVKPTFKKELKKIDVPFSIVARNPELELQKEKISLKMLLQRSVISVVVAIVLSLPLSIITFFRLMATPVKDIDMILSLVHRYSFLYLIILGFSVFAIFIVVPSLRRWHWTKHQF